jgi:putative peptide zinc metalloprotease protein
MNVTIPLEQRTALLAEVPALAGLSAPALAELAASTLLATLPAARLQTLAARLEPLRVPAGATVLRQGEHGDTCYLLASGRVEVLLQTDAAPDRRLATLGPGAFFGEIALLTDSPRIATVRTLEPCLLLTLHRADLVELFRADERVRAYLLDLLQVRWRAQQVPGILVHRQTTATGETIITLKDPQRGAYYRLSPQGWHVWQRLDGQRSLRDLTVAYAQAGGGIAPQAIVHLLADLAAAGFVTGPRLRHDLARFVERAGPWTQASRLARSALTWRVALGGVDAPLTWVYQRAAHVLYTRWGQAVLAALAAVGLVAFVLGVATGTASGATGQHDIPGGGDLLLLVLAYLLSVVIHEAGHACTTKAFGYAVHRIGVGWYWFTPVAYVDTSELWLAPRWPRIAVSLAGPYANAVLGGVAALVAWFMPGGAAASVLWQVAFVNELLVFVNLNPLLEYDGYYVLVDLLECPNLRPRALAWLGREMPGLLRVQRRRPTARWRRTPQQRLEGLYAIYGLGSLLYVAAMAVVTVLLYRVALQGWISRLVPGTVAAGIAWVPAGALVVLCALGLAGELRGVRPR